MVTGWGVLLKTHASCVSDVERGLKLIFQMGVVTIGFFLFDGVQPLDFIGPWVCDDNLRWQPAVINCFVKDVFDSWKQFSKSQVQLLTFGKTKVLKICISNTTNSLALGPDGNLFL